MGMEINFSYAIENKAGFLSPELFSDCLVDLFEAPDMLKHQGAFGGTFESLKEAGFLPSFVENYRDNMGSDLQWILETSEEERAEQLAGSAEDFIEQCGEDWEPPSVDFTFDAAEAEDWSDLWLRLLNSQSFRNPEVLKAMLPYNHAHVEVVKENLEQLHSQATEAKEKNVQLRLSAEMG